MELDQPALQWLLNVVMITGFTSLVVLCYVLKKENQKITLELARRQLRDDAPAVSISEQKTDRTKSPVQHQDIRDFVARRSRDWF